MKNKKKKKILNLRILRFLFSLIINECKQIYIEHGNEIRIFNYFVYWTISYPNVVK